MGGLSDRSVPDFVCHSCLVAFLGRDLRVTALNEDPRHAATYCGWSCERLVLLYRLINNLE